MKTGLEERDIIGSLALGEEEVITPLKDPFEMFRTAKLVAIGVCLVAAMSVFAEDNSAKQKVKKELAVGDVAPEFELKGTDGKVYKLSDFKGKSGVVVAWYPKALTGG